MTETETRRRSRVDDQQGADQPEMRVEELAARAGIGVDTVRYYQAQGLLGRPRRAGRVAWYGPGHLDRLAEIRALADRGFTLAQISDLDRASTDPLLDQLARRHPVDPTLDLAALVERSGLDHGVVMLVVDAGLIRGVDLEGRICFVPTAVDMLAVVARLIDAGLAVDALAALAVRHARHVESLIDDAIELYRDAAPTDRRVAGVEVGLLVPLVANMVAAHFEQTLVDRAVDRLGRGADG